ncbi:MAG: ABC transporter permease [Sphaerochaeta sp.]|nr:ABC transporter permease [Sphaerochaeta sp.]
MYIRIYNQKVVKTTRSVDIGRCRHMSEELDSPPLTCYLHRIGETPVETERTEQAFALPMGEHVGQFESRLNFHRKLAAIVLLVFAVSFFFPFFFARENRISAEIPGGIAELALLPTLLLLLPPTMILLYALIRNSRRSEWLLSFAGTLGLLAPLAVLAYVGPRVVSTLGPFARYSPGSGMYLYLTAVAIVYLMKARIRIGDYIGLAVALAVVLALGHQGSFNRLGILLEARNFGTRLSREILAHIRITGISIGISVLVGIPLALVTFQSRRMRKLVFPLLNVLQTIPGIALFGLLIAPLAALSQAFPQLREWGIKGIGNTPAIIALSMYALYPIIRYSFTAISSIDASVVLAAQGMGMSSGQVWRIVRFPLATPGILHGIRVALVQTIGNATLAKLIGGDGLGVLVFEGLGQASVDMVLLGMLLIIALTVAADRIFQILITVLTPISLRREGA